MGRQWGRVVDHTTMNGIMICIFDHANHAVIKKVMKVLEVVAPTVIQPYNNQTLAMVVNITYGHRRV